MMFWLHVIRASWRVAFGRWYVWRDAPTNIVRRIAVLWYFQRKQPEEEGSELIRQAYEEYQLRKRRGEA